MLTSLLLIRLLLKPPGKRVAKSDHLYLLTPFSFFLTLTPYLRSSISSLAAKPAAAAIPRSDNATSIDSAILLPRRTTLMGLSAVPCMNPGAAMRCGRQMVDGVGSVEQPIDGRAPFRSFRRRRNDPAVGPDHGLAPRPPSRGVRRQKVRPRNADVSGRRSGRRVKRALASTPRNAKRGDKRAHSSNPGKAQFGLRTQFGPPSAAPYRAHAATT